MRDGAVGTIVASRGYLETRLRDGGDVSVVWMTAYDGSGDPGVVHDGARRCGRGVRSEECRGWKAAINKA